MKKSSLGLLVIFTALLGYVFFVERKHPPKLPGEEKRIFHVEPGEIQKIKISRGGNRVVLERTDAKNWKITAPINDQANSMEAENLARNLATLESLEILSGNEKPEAYGLTKSAAAIQAETKSGASVRLTIGDKAPTGQGFYAYNPVDGQIDLIPTSLGEALFRPADSWRDLSALHFDSSKISKILLENRGKKFLLSKLRDSWEMESPVRAKADENQVTQFLSSLSGLEISEFSGNTAAEGSGPVLSISVWETGEKNPKTLTLRKKVATGYLTETSGRKSRYILPESSLKFLFLNPNDYKDHHLLTVFPEQITRIEITKNKKSYAFDKEKDGWVLTQPERNTLDGVKAVMILADLQQLEEEKGKKPPAALPEPQTKLTLWAGKIKKAEILIGKRVFRRSGVSYVVQIEAPEKKFAYADADFLIRDIPVN